MSEESLKPPIPNKYQPLEEVVYKGKDCYIGTCYLTDDYAGYCYDLYTIDGSNLFLEIYEEDLEKENKKGKNMNITTFFQDVFNAMVMKKPWYVYLLKFLACVCFGMGTSWAFGTVPSLIITILTCIVIFTLMDYFFYLTNMNNCLDKIDQSADKVEEAFKDNQFFKDKDGVPYNVYRLYFRCKDDNFHFSVLEYGETEESLWNLWMDNDEVRKHYALYKVDLIKKRRPEKKDE